MLAIVLASAVAEAITRDNIYTLKLRRYTLKLRRRGIELDAPS